ncbi:MAG: DNA repair protein RecN [Burkholderiaceae bacterium]|jgi:DNA repair protein RecN (Recombination protein N)|nr:DNA repair protein RecN [Burkholderiaceae bacterium]
MLEHLAIRDFVIVDKLELGLSAGFSVLTGETGAGKSILVDALALVLGARGDPGVVREGADRADIGALFSVQAAVLAWLRENDFPVEDDQVLLRRVIDLQGRSRCFINGSPATATQLRDLGNRLVDIHGQHAHQSLLQKEGQRLLLDRHAGLQGEADQLAELYRAWQTWRARRQEGEAQSAVLQKEKERVLWQMEELDALAPRAAEWEDLAQEHNRLVHATRLMDGARESLHVLSESDSPVLHSLHTIRQKLLNLSEVDAALVSPTELLDSAHIQLQEAAYTLNDYLSRIEVDPERLAYVESRMDALLSAARKYRVQPEQLPAEWDAIRAKWQEMTELQDMAALGEKEEAARRAYTHAAESLSQKRREAAQSLEKAVTRAMEGLSMAGGRFSILLEPGEPASYGVDRVEFHVAGHAGASPRPLAKVASGGELARLSLAISVITSGATETPTLIFDEVDSGIGGGVAEVVGSLLKELGRAHQVLCVTHLPQVASQAGTHFQVSKVPSDAVGHPVSRIVALSEGARVEEIARMLGGVEITATTRRHAREMLSS